MTTLTARLCRLLLKGRKNSCLRRQLPSAGFKIHYHLIDQRSNKIKVVFVVKVVVK